MTDSLEEVFSKYKQPTTAELRKVVVEIKKLQKSNASISDQGYYDRLQRASSWLAKATQIAGDAEATFIFLWIALDALSSIRPEVLSTEWWTKQRSHSPQSISDKVVMAREKWNGFCGEFVGWMMEEQSKA